MQSSEAIERLGELYDQLDSLSASLSMPIDAGIHLSAMRESLPEIRNEIREIYDALGGEDVWGG